ncbi:MAG: response regulator [Proteobacteria bacterium]|nr:response regulator [Pseudomonadota bacterium]
MSAYRPRYLVIDDNPDDIEILRRLLGDMSNGKAEVKTFTDAESALSNLGVREFDLIFLDYVLGKQTGLEILSSIKDKGCISPVVVLTGQGSEQVAVDAMKAGVADYIVKEDLNTAALDRVVTNALTKFKLEQQVKEQHLRLTEKVQELQDALDHVKTLQGLLPICMYCKKIRDDKGIWDQIEKYIAQHSDVNFSHSICPNCVDEHFPGLLASTL